MPVNLGDIAQDEDEDPQLQERETLLDKYKKDPLEGLVSTATMFMPSWITGEPRGDSLSLGDTVRSMVEWTPVVGDWLDLQEGMRFSNDLDPLERGLALFAGIPVVGGAAHVGRTAHSNMRTRYREQIATLYDETAVREAFTPFTIAPAPAAAGAERPMIPMIRDLEPTDFESIQARLRAAVPGIGEEFRERLSFAPGGVKPRHLRVSTAHTMEQLSYALWGPGRELVGVEVEGTGPSFDAFATPELAEDMRLETHPQRGAYAAFVVELGTLMINTGLFEAEGGPVKDHVGSIFNTALPDWSTELSPDIMAAASHALSIYTQAFDAGLLHGYLFDGLAQKFENGLMFRQAAELGNMTASRQMAEFISLIGELSEIVMRHGGPDLTMTPNMKWNSFYSTPDGRLQGNLNLHVLPSSRLLDPESGHILDEAGLKRRLWSMDYNTLVGHFVQSMLAIETGVTSVAVSDTHREAAKKWYPQFNKLIEVVAERYGLRRFQVGAIVAALSPRAIWDPDNINWAILGAAEATRGTMGQAEQLQELNEVRVLAGFQPVTTIGRERGLGSGEAKVASILDGMNPVEALRMLKTMSFLHNGLFPEGTAANSPFGLAVITADTHHFRAITGFYHSVEAPWFKSTMKTKERNWLTGATGWWSNIAEDMIARLEASDELSTNLEGLVSQVPAGLEVPSFTAERMYDAAVRATVVAADILGISPIEAQARFWQPVMEVANSGTLGGNKTVVWHDGVLSELEGRSPTSPSLTDSLGTLDSKLIDPQIRHLDMFTVADTHQFEPGVGILVAAGPTGIRVYADPTVEGVADQLRTARPIDARPRLFIGRKEGLTLDPRIKPRRTKLDPVRWIARHARSADLAVVQQASIESSPAGEFRTVTDPSTRPGIPDVHSPGNYIVVEVAQGNTASVQSLTANGFPLVEVTEVGITHQTGPGRGTAKLTADEVEAGLHRRASENPLTTQTWVMVPAGSRKLLNRLKRNGFEAVESYVRDSDGETRRTFIVFGLTDSFPGISDLETYWTQDAQHSGGVATPSLDGVTMGATTDGVSFGILGDPGTTEFTIDYQADEAIEGALTTRSTATAPAAGKRTQLIIELGSVPDPAMVRRLWENLDLDGAVVSLSGYFHGALWADPKTMTRVGEYSYTNGNERLTHRAQHQTHLIEDENYNMVWVPLSEAARLDTSHGVFPSRSTQHTVTVERSSNNSVVIDGETTIISSGEELEINTEKLFQSKVDGNPVKAMAVTRDPETGRPMMMMADSVEALEANEFYALLFPQAAVFHVGSRGRIVRISNDTIPVPPTMETGIGTVTDAERVEGETAETLRRPVGGTTRDTHGFETERVEHVARQAGIGSGAPATGQVGTGPVVQDPLQIETTALYDPKYTAEINDVWAAIELLLRYGASTIGIRSALKNHPLGASINSRISNMGPLMAAQQGFAGSETTIWEWSRGHATRQAAFNEYVQTGDSTALDAVLKDASGEVGGDFREEARSAKSMTLDPDLQKVYKEVARLLIGDFSLFPDTPIPLLAAYRVADRETHHTVVMHALGLWGALAERPGHIVEGNEMRGLPGIKWFRERHKGVMFPGIIALQGSLGVGASSAGARRAGDGGTAGTFFPPSHNDTLTERGDVYREWAYDENRERVSGSGIHIDVGMTYTMGNVEAHDRYMRLLSPPSRSAEIAAKVLAAAPDVPSMFSTLTAVHEFGHAAHHVVIEMGRGHLMREGVAQIVAKHGGTGMVLRSLGRYAAGSWREAIAESFQEVMVLGADAHPLAIEIVDMMWDLLYDPDAFQLETPRTGERGRVMGGPQELPFWAYTMSDWEFQEHDLATSGDPGYHPYGTITPGEARTSVVAYIDWLGQQSQRATARKRIVATTPSANWSQEDRAAIPNA